MHRRIHSVVLAHRKRFVDFVPIFPFYERTVNIHRNSFLYAEHFVKKSALAHVRAAIEKHGFGRIVIGHGRFFYERHSARVHILDAYQTALRPMHYKRARQPRRVRLTYEYTLNVERRKTFLQLAHLFALYVAHGATTEKQGKPRNRCDTAVNKSRENIIRVFGRTDQHVHSPRISALGTNRRASDR